MSEKKIWNAMGEIDGALVEEAGKLLAGEGKYGKGRMPGTGKKPEVSMVIRIGVMAAMAALVIFLGAHYRNVPEEYSMQLAEMDFLVQRAASPEKPESHLEMDIDEKVGSEEQKIFHQDSMLSSVLGENANVATAFYEKSLREVFLNRAGENVVFSPVSLYLALGMLSEISGGNTQREILAVMGGENLEEAREECKDLWSRLCWRENQFQPILGQSIWMGKEISYSEEMVRTLAEQHYASSFLGAAGEERAWAMEDWLDDFLIPVSRQTDGEEISQKTFDLLSVIACKEEWREGEGFDGKGTEKGIFHQKDGREKEVSFLRGVVQEKNVTAAERYCSVNLGLAGGSSLSVYLPEEGVELEEILRKDLGEILSRPREGENEGGKQNRVNVFLPKFEVTSDISLNAELRKLGVQGAFQEGIADFSPLIAGKDGKASEQETSPAAGDIRQSTRVVLDERGCGTESRRDADRAGEDSVLDEDGQKEEKNVICDRPFLYIIRNQENMPVLAGTIYSLEE